MRRTHPPAKWRTADWPDLDDWLYGVDLFNHFYFWEAHEVWENLWSTADPESQPRMLLQGLIQVAAALLKTHQGVVEGAATLATNGLSKIEQVARAESEQMGLELPTVVGQLQSFFEPLSAGRLPVLGAETPVLRLALPSSGDGA